MNEKLADLDSLYNRISTIPRHILKGPNESDLDRHKLSAYPSPRLSVDGGAYLSSAFSELTPGNCMYRHALCATAVLIGCTLTGCNSVPAPKQIAAGWTESIRESVVGPKQDDDLAKQSYAKGETAFQAATRLQAAERRAAFAAAIPHYTEAARRSSGTPLEEDALTMKAESQFFADEYVKAGETLDLLVKRFPSTRHMDHIDQRRFAIAEYWLKLKKDGQTTWYPNFTDKQRPSLDTFGYSTKMLDKIRFDNPTGKLADDATMKAAIAKFERNQFGAADMLFTDLRKNFVKSEHQFEAHLLGLKCKLEMYEGPDYDGGMLEEAEEIIKNMWAAFPRESEPHREYLAGAHKDIRLKMANRDYSIAKFYDNRKEYGAARIYYQQVAEKFADTNLAIESENRLTAIGGLPPAPEQSMEWLANLFPDEETAKPLLK